MALVCEDLAQYGVVLIPPTTEEYFALLADIEQRLQNRPKGGPPLEDGALSRISEHDTTGSAILVNRASVAIASIAYIWTFRRRDGREWPARYRPGPGRILLPYGTDNRFRKFDAYWNTIFPGSKRLMTAECQMQFGKVRFQIQPDGLPVLRRRFHHHLADSSLRQPAHHMRALAVARSETPALELQRLADRILYRAVGGGHHHHQHLLVNVNRCYSVRHVVLSARKGQNARQLKYAPLRAVALPHRTDNAH